MTNNDSKPDKLAHALKLIRLYHNVSQREMSTKSGMHHSWIAGIESGKIPIKETTLKKYSEYFGISVFSLKLFSEYPEDKTGNKIRNLAWGKVLRIIEWLIDGKEIKND